MILRDWKKSFAARKAKTEYEKSLIKVTCKSDSSEPKEKHLFNVLNGLKGGYLELSKDKALTLLRSKLADSE